MLTVLIFIYVMTMVYCYDNDHGYPGGFFRYGDKNGDNVIDRSDLEANLNMAWLAEWYRINKNLTNIKNMKMTIVDFNNLMISKN